MARPIHVRRTFRRCGLCGKDVRHSKRTKYYTKDNEEFVFCQRCSQHMNGMFSHAKPVQ